MKKLLGIVVLGLILSGNAYAIKINKGKGNLKIDPEAIEQFHTYLSRKFNQEDCNSLSNEIRFFYCGGIFPTDKKIYGSHFIILDKKKAPRGYIVNAHRSQLNRKNWMIGMCLMKPYGKLGYKCKVFAIGNKIVWKGFEKTVSRDISLDELKLVFKNLGIQTGEKY